MATRLRVVPDATAPAKGGRRAPAKKAAPRKRAAKKPPKTLSEAVESGVYLEILLAQRRDIVTALPSERGPAKAALHKQLRELSSEIQSLQKAAEVTAGKDSVVSTTSDKSWDQSAI